MTIGTAKPRPAKGTAAKAKARAKRQQAAADHAVYAAVTARDGGLCRANCGYRHGSHRHHIVFRSQGGQTTTANVCLLCEACHQAVHDRTMRIIGRDANAPLHFELVRCDHKFIDSAACLKCGWTP